MKTYADVMFTPAVCAQQDRDRTGESYARRYASMDRSKLGPDEADFLGSRTSIYMASVSETGWPYVQHRGGPAGFLKVLDTRRWALRIIAATVSIFPKATC
ncbi:MAG: hypothetical protein P8Q26_11460 [Ascidiaceihabitans sp.]|nr:hypothetical protein [Ascidiaceihabitans sp.]